MISGYLLDEHLPAWWRKEVVRLHPALTVWRIGDPNAPPLGTPDPLILEWCEASSFILVTNNRASMPGHLRDHTARGRHVPGVFIVDPSRHVTQLAEDLALLAGASFENEYQDLVLHLSRLV